MSKKTEMTKRDAMILKTVKFVWIKATKENPHRLRWKTPHGTYTCDVTSRTHIYRYEGEKIGQATMSWDGLKLVFAHHQTVR